MRAATDGTTILVPYLLSQVTATQLKNGYPGTRVAVIWRTMIFVQLRNGIRYTYPDGLGPFYYHGLTLIQTWISNYSHYNVWDEIAYPFPNFNGITVEVWEWINNFTHILWACDYLSILGLKLIHISRRDPCCLIYTKPSPETTLIFITDALKNKYRHISANIWRALVTKYRWTFHLQSRHL